MDEENSLNFGLSTFNYVNSEFLFQDALWNNFQDIPFTANEVNLANSNVDETIKNENSLTNDYFGGYDPSHVFTASTSTAQTQQDVSNTPSFTTEIPKIPSEDVNCNCSSIPASMNWPGEFNFSIAFGSQKKNTKGVSWTYSDVKNKLYVGKDASCPINFSVNTSLPAGVFIRAMALYSTSEHMSEVVHRCANHSTEEKKKGVLEAEHLIRCESNMASYQVDEYSGRHSVVVPFDNPPAGQEFSTYLYKFTCFGSCAGGPNRRPLMVVFTLEKQRQVIGRRRLDVKICACPGRDKKLEEMSCMTSENNKESTKESSSAFETDEYVAQTERPATYPPAKKAKMSSNEESVYTIAVDDYDCYVFLKLMKHLYHLNILSPERLRTLGSCSQEME